MKFYLSVARDGIVSLWDSAKIRNRGCMKGETAVDLTLTAEQATIIKQAAKDATVDNQ